MLSKNELKYVRSLSQGKFRKLHGSFVAEGSTVIQEFIDEGAEIEFICAMDESVVQNYKGKFHSVNKKELGRISFLRNPQDAIAVIKKKVIPALSKDSNNGFSIVCDRIQDPGNLGTIVRIADWFGIDKVICSEGSADVYNPKVVQATMGSLARIEVHYTDLVKLIGESKSKSLALILGGKNIYKTELPKSGFIVIGNEANGIEKDLLEKCSNQISIPGKGNAESLNAAIATGIICAELNRLDSI